MELIEYNEIDDNILKSIILEGKNNLEKIKTNLDRIENKETLIFNIKKIMENNGNIFAFRWIIMRVFWEVLFLVISKI